MPTTRLASLGCLALVLTSLLAPAAAHAVALRWPEGDTARTLRVSTPAGGALAEGTYEQWRDGERLRVRLAYRFADGRHIEEEAVFRQQPELVQERWSWSERRGEELSRQYAVDFATGQATGLKHAQGKTKRWDDTLEVKPGSTFAGVGFALAARQLQPRLLRGEKVELHALAFTPRPRRVKVSLRHAGTQPDASGAPLERIVIHPEIGLAAWLVEAPDTRLLFNRAAPPDLVGGEGTLLEPADPLVHTEVLTPPQGSTAAARHDVGH